MPKRKNIMLQPVAEKEEVYRQIDALFARGEEVKHGAHRSGFPAVYVDCGDIHIITDTLSLEDWRRKTPLPARKPEANKEAV